MMDEVEFGVVVQSRNFSCSGLIIDGEKGLILTVGSIANGLVNDIALEIEQNNFADVAKLKKDDIKVQIVARKICKNYKLNASKGNFLTLDGLIVALWRDKSLYELQKKIFPEGEWTFENGKMDEKENWENSNLNEDHSSNFNLADFALIEVKELAKYMSGVVYLSDVKAQTGDPVSIVGTPFGLECYPLFFNSLSKGIVSNTIGASNEMILTDARCVPGSEGCLVFIKPSEYYAAHLPSCVTYQGLNAGMVPYGIVVAPFCWRSGEWIGLTLVCSISYLLRNMLKSSILSPNHPSRQAIRDMLSQIVYHSETSTSLVPKLHPTESSSSTSKLCSKKKPLSDSLISNLYSKETQTSLCISGKSKPHQCDVLQRAVKSVVLLQAGATWGSGMIIDANKGLVITCRHILTEGGILSSRDSTKKAYVPLVIHDTSLQKVYNKVDVLFATETDCSIDFAVLRVKNSSFQSSIEMGNTSNITTKDKDTQGIHGSNILSKDTPVIKSYNILTNDTDVDSANVLTKGADIFAVGYSTFGCETSNLPSVTAGIISNISLVHGSPAILQTTAAIHCGGSGGAIISKHSGQLLGMVTCNIKDGNSSTSFPHVNFSIPVNMIYKLVELSMYDDEIERVKELSRLVSGSERAWCLIDTKQPVKSKL